jgi:hypothetical protein
MPLDLRQGVFSVEDPGFGAFLTTGFGMEKIWIRDEHPAYISESLRTVKVFWVKYGN